MDPRFPKTLDMTPQGEFRAPPAPLLSWPARIAVAALGVSFVTGLVASLALLAYIALLLIPVAIGAGLIGYLALRLQLRRARGRVILRP